MSLANLIRGKRAPDRVATATPATFATHTATASRWWLIHYADRDPVEVACCPEATHAGILERHPDAITAEPFEPSIRQPSASMTGDEGQTILAWLARIGETDADTISEVLTGCRSDAEVRDYFIRRAGEARPLG